MPDRPLLRPLDPGERFFHWSDQVSCMNFAVFAERDGPLEPGRIRSALDALQGLHLLLQVAVVDREGHGPCFAPVADTGIDLQCHSTDARQWQECLTQALLQPFAEGTAPLMRCHYLELAPTAADGQRRSVLVLCFHHAIADGRSGMALLRQLLGHLAGSTAQPALTISLPAMAELVPEPFRWAEQPDNAQRVKAAVVGDYRRHGALSPVPWLDSAAAASAPRLTRLQLNADTSQRLLARARAERTTVHGVLCAAQLLAQCRLQPEADAQTLLLSMPVDMRAHLTPAPAAAPTGLFVSIVSASYRLTADTGLWPLAREIRDHVGRQLARGEAHLFYELYGLNDAAPAPGQADAFRRKVRASLPNTMVSNVGRIDPVAEDPLVQSLSFALFPMPYQSLFTAASSYRDALTLNIGFDAARLSAHSIASLTDAIQSTLLAAAT